MKQTHTLRFRITSSSISLGYSRTSVNNCIFRKSSLVTFENKQYIAYYDWTSRLVLGCRYLPDGKWHTHRTCFKALTRDAHRGISLGVDGDGYLHIAFDHHDSPLKYCRSVSSGSLKHSSLMPMTGNNEDSVTYPEFHNLPNGDLLFAYREGRSGCGNLVLKSYSVKSHTWKCIHDVLIDGEGQRNAYWQICTDKKGTIHISWTWRETNDVATNHDICYACSHDGGTTWQHSDGTHQILPITVNNAEYAVRIPQNSDLINQTSMDVNQDGHPYIATYWRDVNSDVPQYRLVWNDGDVWHTSVIGHRTFPFTLSGLGTKSIPISRPQIVINKNGKVFVVYRNIERGGCVSMACAINPKDEEWEIVDLTTKNLKAWEPTLDIIRWRRDEVLSLFVQKCSQIDGEKESLSLPRIVRVVDVELQ